MGKKLNIVDFNSACPLCIIVCTMCLLYICSLMKWCSRRTVKQSARVSQTQALSVKSIPALRTPSAWSRKELGHATTQASYCFSLVLTLFFGIL